MDYGPRHRCRAPTCSPCGRGHLCFLRHTRSKLESTYKLKRPNKSAKKEKGPLQSSPQELPSPSLYPSLIVFSNSFFFTTFQRYVKRENKVLQARYE